MKLEASLAGDREAKALLVTQGSSNLLGDFEVYFPGYKQQNVKCVDDSGTCAMTRFQDLSEAQRSLEQSGLSVQRIYPGDSVTITF